MNWVEMSFREWLLVSEDGEILDVLIGNHLGHYTISSTGKAYINLEQAKKAAIKSKEIK